MLNGAVQERPVARQGRGRRSPRRCRPRDTFFFAGMSLRGRADRHRGSAGPRDQPARRASRPMAARGCRSRPTSPTRVRGFLAHPEEWRRFPDDVREWLEVQRYRSALPEPGQLLVETFPREGRHYMVAYSFEGWNAHQSLGMLLTRRMETQGLKPLGFVANDYAHRHLFARAGDRPARAVLARHPRARVRRLGAAIASAQARVPRGRGDRRAGRAPASGQAQDRASRSPSRPT